MTNQCVTWIDLSELRQERLKHHPEDWPYTLLCKIKYLGLNYCPDAVRKQGAEGMNIEKALRHRRSGLIQDKVGYIRKQGNHLLGELLIGGTAL